MELLLHKEVSFNFLFKWSYCHTEIKHLPSHSCLSIVVFAPLLRSMHLADKKKNACVSVGAIIVGTGQKSSVQRDFFFLSLARTEMLVCNTRCVDCLDAAAT